MSILPGERIFVPLDTREFTNEHRRFVDEVAPYIGGFKIGITAFFNELVSDQRITAGSAATSYLRSYHPNLKRFIDGKFKDIPDQIAGAAYGASMSGAWGFTIHADNTPAAIKAAVLNRGASLAIGVTVLTSYDEKDCDDTYREAAGDAVVKFALRLKENGGKAIVCSPLELLRLSHSRVGDGLIKITPGIRDPNSPPDDQRRTATAFEAARDGADYFVIGRLLTGAKDKVSMAKRLCDDIERGIAARGR